MKENTEVPKRLPVPVGVSIGGDYQAITLDEGDQATGSTTILEQMKALEKAKAERIAYLLADREKRIKDHESHLKAIATELQALGYKKLRGRRAKSAEKAAAK